MGSLKPLLAKLALHTALFIALLVVAVALSVLGLVWITDALTSALTPWLGHSPASALTGVLCILPLVWLLYSLYRKAQQEVTPFNKASDGLRDLVRENPWEAVGAAFLLGISQPRGGVEGLAAANQVLRNLRTELGGSDPTAARAEPRQGKD